MIDERLQAYLSTLPSEARERFMDAWNEMQSEETGNPTEFWTLDAQELERVAANLALNFSMHNPVRSRVLVDIVTELSSERLKQQYLVGDLLSRKARCQSAMLAVTLSKEVAAKMLEGVDVFGEHWHPYVIGPEPHPPLFGSIYHAEHPLFRTRLRIVRAVVERLARTRNIFIDPASRVRLKKEKDLRTLELWLLSVLRTEAPDTLSFVEC